MSQEARADFYAELRNRCELAGGQSRWAIAHGISTSYVNDVLTARREPGAKMLAALGWRRVTTLIPNEGRNS